MRTRSPRFARYRPGGSRWRRLGAIQIRPAEAGDAHAVARISHANRGGILGRIEERVGAEIIDTDERQLLLIACAASRVAGFARARHFEPTEDDASNSCGAGWYLLGVVVAPRFRRAGIASELTRDRLRWIAGRADEAFYFVHERNLASIALHDAFGFREISRDFTFPNVTFHQGTGVLFRVDLSAEPPREEPSSSRRMRS